MQSFLAKISVWNIVAGAVLTIAVLFGTGMVTLSGSAERMAAERSNTAVVEALTPVCVQNATADPLFAERIAELNEGTAFSRASKVEGFGWATMPGSERANREVARDCASAVVAL